MIGRYAIRKTTLLIVGAIALVSAVALAVGLYFGLQPSDDKSRTNDKKVNGFSYEGIYSSAAVTANGYPCAAIGRDILMKNGSAVEAAIAALICEGVVCLQSMGLGGGFLMTIYERKTRKVITLNAREVAPLAANKTMFQGNESLSQTGGLAAAVPGELRGYWEAYKRYKSGNVEWRELVQPTIELCRNGITVTSYLANHLKTREDVIKQHPSLSEILVNKETNSVWKEGDKYRRLKLAETLEVIRDETPEALYNGSLTDGFVKDIQELGGIITKEDMANYRPSWSEPVTSKLKNGITMYTIPLPGSGVLLSLLFNILNNFVPSGNNITDYQRKTEALKHAYGRRTQLGDPKFVDMEELIEKLTSTSFAELVKKNISDNATSQNPNDYGADVILPEDHGTAHLCVLAPNGDAVSVTSTINFVLGAKVRSNSTGIILNDEMDDFSAPNITNGFGVPPSPNNFIEPGKQPISSMVPSIFIDSDGEVQLVTGAAGGTKITSSTFLIAMNVLWFNKTIKEAIEEPRFHHQLFPMTFQYEEGTPQEIVDGLHKIGHVTKNIGVIDSSVTGIARKDGQIHAHSDSRRSGVTAGF